MNYSQFEIWLIIALMGDRYICHSLFVSWIDRLKAHGACD